VSTEKFINLLEASKTPRSSDFTRVRNVGRPKDDEGLNDLAFFKLVATLGNLHATVSDYYALRGDNAKGKYHLDLANRFRTESNKAK